MPSKTVGGEEGGVLGHDPCGCESCDPDPGNVPRPRKRRQDGIPAHEKSEKWRLPPFAFPLSPLRIRERRDRTGRSGTVSATVLQAADGSRREYCRAFPRS